MSTHFDPTQSDESLCFQAIQGDRRAEEALVLRYNRLVRICTRPYFLAGGDSEDLLQEGMMGLLKAIREFNPDRGAAFRSFAETCIRSRIYSALRAATRDKHAPLNDATSLEFPLFNGNPDYPLDPTQSLQPSPEDLLIRREERQERLGSLHGQLSKLESDILHLYLQGFSYAEIGNQLDRTPKAVDNAVQRLRRKIAQHLTSGDFSQG